MGTPRPHVSRYVSGRAPRRGRRPRRPVSAHHRIPVYSRLSLRRGRRPRRPVSVHPRIPAHSRLSLRRGRRPRRPVFCSPIAGCTRVLHVCLRRPYFFQQRKKYGKERRQKPSVFGFPFRPIVTAVQKGSAPNRLHSYPRCRSCVPRENFLLSRRTEKVLYILHTFIFCGPKGRTYTCRRRRQVRDLIIVLNGRPASPPPTTSAAARVNPWPIPCGTFSIRTEIGLKKIQKPSVFGGVFAHFCRCWQKRVAPESEMSPPRASAQNDTPPAEPEGYRSSHDLKTCPC